MLCVFQRIVALLNLLVVSGQNLRKLAHSLDFNVSIVLHDEPSCANVTRPCMYVHAMFSVFSGTKVSICDLISSQQLLHSPLLIEEIVKLGDKINHKVVARSGGVCSFYHIPKLFHDALLFSIATSPTVLGGKTE